MEFWGVGGDGCDNISSGDSGIGSGSVKDDGCDIGAGDASARRRRRDYLKVWPRRACLVGVRLSLLKS